MADAPRLITAAELDQMTPDERSRLVNQRIVSDLDELPAGFRRRVEATVDRLADQLDRPAVE